MDDKKPAKEEAHRVYLDKPLCAGTEIPNQEKLSAWEKLALLAFGLSVSSGAFALDQVAWRPGNIAGSLQNVERQVPGCFPTAATQTATLVKGTELDQGITVGENGGSWATTRQSIYCKDPLGSVNRLEPANPVDGILGMLFKTNRHSEPYMANIV